MSKNLLQQNPRGRGSADLDLFGGGSSNLPSKKGNYTPTTKQKNHKTPTRKKPQRVNIETPPWLQALVRFTTTTSAALVGLGLSVIGFVWMLIWSGQSYAAHKTSTDAMIAFVGKIILTIIFFSIAIAMVYILIKGFNASVYEGKEAQVRRYVTLFIASFFGFAIIGVFVWAALITPAYNGQDPVGDKLRPVANTAAGIFQGLTEENPNYTEPRGVEGEK